MLVFSHVGSQIPSNVNLAKSTGRSNRLHISACRFDIVGKMALSTRNQHLHIFCVKLGPDLAKYSSLRADFEISKDKRIRILVFSMGAAIVPCFFSPVKKSANVSSNEVFFSTINLQCHCNWLVLSESRGGSRIFINTGGPTYIID